MLRPLAPSPASLPTLETLCIRSFLRVLETACSRPKYNAEAARGEYAVAIPWGLRQQLLEELLKCGRLHDTVQILVLETLLSPDVRRLAVRHVRRWYRCRFLDLLASGRAAGLRVLLLEDVAWLTGSPVSSAPLASALRALPHLRQVSLRFVCDDSVLASLGACCPQLQEVDMGGSRAVSDVGVQKMCIRRDVWKSADAHGKQPKCLDVVTRSFRGVFLTCFLEDALNLQNSLPQWWRDSVIKRARRNPCCKTLRLVNFASTQVTNRGIELFRSCAPLALAKL